MSLPAEIEALVFDRTQADVDRVKELKRIWMTGGTWTQDESDEYMAGLKGCYNYQDLNRVGEAVAVIAAEIQTVGAALKQYMEDNDIGPDPLFAPLDPDMLDVDPKTDWAMTDIPTETQMQRYIHDIQNLYSLVPIPDQTLKPPDNMSRLTWQKANDIEKILYEIWTAIPTVEAEQQALMEGAVNNRIYGRPWGYNTLSFEAGELDG